MIQLRCRAVCLSRSLKLTLLPRSYASKPIPPPTIIEGVTHPSDSWTNVSPTILSKIPLTLHRESDHPLSIIRSLIESHFEGFTALQSPSAVVTVRENFDELGFPIDHPGRAPSDSYYVNKDTVLRTHTSAHELAAFKSGLEHWLLAADVYRRDEIDASHYPVFHQMEGASVWTPFNISELPELNEKLRQKIASSASPLLVSDPTHPPSPENPVQPEHDEATLNLMIDNLKLSLNSLILTLFRTHTDQKGEPLQVRWIETTFPWTAPSYEVEVYWGGDWLEVLGCGIIKQDLLTRSGVPQKQGWAFGLGLERLAMILFSIPDIRLFWSQDPRFSSQFSKARGITTFKPYSKYPECYKDVSFWLPKAEGESEAIGWHENDFCDAVRDLAGDFVESVTKFDEFTNPKTGRRSLAYRINYRSMDRNLTNAETNDLHHRVTAVLQDKFGVEIR